jgi:endonuclease G
MAKSVFKGYDPAFIDEHEVPLPALSLAQKKDTEVLNDNGGLLEYVNYSVSLSPSRRFPYFTASNIDGNLFKKAPRKDNWRRDDRIAKEFQWGPELYKAKKSDFDKGHMTKREDVQWGRTIAVASKAADSTFFYTNAVPQHANLNQKIWRSLEDYILHTETKENGLKVSVFTGPVLSNKDPFFVTEVSGEQLRIPTIFWKVVVYPKSDGKLYRVGFLMSQATLLKENGIARETPPEGLESTEDRLFMEFDDADTYQVNVSTIEELTRLKMPEAEETYKDDRKIKLILKEIDVTESSLESTNVLDQLGFSISGISL